MADVTMKGSRVVSVLDSSQPYAHLVGYAMLEDAWIHEDNKVVLLGDGSTRNILDHRKERRYELRFRECMPYENGYMWRSRVYVLLDGPVSEGDVLHLFHNASVINATSQP